MKYDISHPNFLKEDGIVQDKNGNTFFVYDPSARRPKAPPSWPLGRDWPKPNPYGLGIFGLLGIASKLGPIPAGGAVLGLSAVAQAGELKKQAEVHAQNIKIANDNNSSGPLPRGLLRDIVMR